MTLLNFKIASHLLLRVMTTLNPSPVSLLPSLYHVTSGAGLPIKMHFNSTSDPSAVVTTGWGTLTISGVTKPWGTEGHIIKHGVDFVYRFVKQLNSQTIVWHIFCCLFVFILVSWSMFYNSSPCMSTNPIQYIFNNMLDRRLQVLQLHCTIVCNISCLFVVN